MQYGFCFVDEMISATRGWLYDYSIYCKCFTVLKVQRPALWRVPVPLVVSIFASRGEILWRRHQTLRKP